MYKYTPIQTENSVKKTKGILYCNHLPENGQIIGKVDLSDATIDKNAEACLCVNETDYTVMPMETEDDANKMKGFIPVSDKNSPDIYYLAIEKIHRLPLWICGLVPLAAVSIVALSVGIPAFLRPENKPQVESNPVIVADNDVTPTPIPTPARETIAPSATETRQAAQEDTTPEKKEDRIPDRGKDQIAVVHVADIKTPAPTEAPKVEEDTKKDDDTKTTSTPNPTVTPAPTTTPHVHTYVVEEQAATCTDLEFYKKYCSECGYVVADHTCTALGHTNSVASVSNMTYPEGMKATYICDRCGETITDNFDYTSGLYKEDGSLLYTYDALEQVFDWNLSTTIAKDLMDAHTELSDGRILVLPSWSHLMEVAEASGKDCGLIEGNSDDSIAFAKSVLTEVVLPDDIPYLGNWFKDTNIEKLYLPDSITEYRGLVSNNSNLHYLKVSAGVPEITATFLSNNHLSTLIIPEGVTALKSTAFAMCGRDNEDGMKEYGVEEGVYGLYSDETYANAVEQHKTENTSLTASPVEMLQLSETQLFDSTKEDTQKSEKTEAHTHLLSIDEKAPTCTEDGYYRITCSTCGEVLADHVCKRRGHNMYMVDPEDNTANIICPVFKCNRCDYTESTNHTHNWIAKGYENMTYPDGGDAVYVCATCLNKKTDHCDAVPGMYDENGKLMYTYSELENKFDWNLSTTPAKTLMDDHTELANGSILLLPSWKYLSKVAEDSGADCGLIKTGSPACFQNSPLSKVILPDDCNDFGNWFCGSNVTELELPDSITDYKGCSVSSNGKLRILKLSVGAPDLSTFKAQGNSELTEIIFPEGIEKIGDTTFAGNIKLKTVELPSTLTDIGRSAFAASVIESLEIPANVKEIDSSNHSLAGMSKLKTLVLNDGVEKIDSYSFSSLSALENVYIPKSVTEMGRGIFSGLYNLKNVTFQEGLTVIGDNLFQGCANLREIIIPNSIKNIPDNLFTGAANLNLIILPEELDSIGGDGLFSCGQNSDELKIIMPTTVKEWRSGAAFSSPKLKEIVLPGNVDFPIGLINNGCGLEKVVITSEPNSIAYGAFGNLHNADIYYYGSKESVEKFNADAGDKDVFFLTDNNNRLHYMTGTPPTREDQMNGIDSNSLEEVTTQSISSEIPAAEGMSLPTVVSLPVTKEMIDTNISESTDNTKETKSPKSVSDGDAA